MSQSKETHAPTLPGGSKIDVPTLPLQHAPVGPEQDGGDQPTTGSVALGTLAGAAFGVWEMRAGTMFDVEAEEIFIVTEGRGQVVIGPFDGLPEKRVELSPGTLMRLSEGMKTTWTITHTLRKVYVTPDNPTVKDSGENSSEDSSNANV